MVRRDCIQTVIAGAMTVGNALKSLQGSTSNNATPLFDTTISFFSPAFSVLKANIMLASLQGRKFKSEDKQNADVLQYQNHYADVVGEMANDVTGEILPKDCSLFGQRLKVMFGSVTSHNCYGKGADGCEVYWGQILKLCSNLPLNQKRLEIKNKPYFSYLIVILIYGCAKPFQPVPVEFNLWGKPGATEKQVKDQMLNCGYPNVGGYDNTYSRERVAESQQCMVLHGYKRVGDWEGVCSLPSSTSLQACKGSSQPINR